MGTKPTNIIHINGKVYDSRTGQLVTSEAGRTLEAKPTSVPAHTGRSIDGMSNPNKTGARPSAPVRTTPRPAPPKVHGAKTQRAQTLMRRSVHKPTAVIKPVLKVQAPVRREGGVVLQPKLSANAVHQARAQHAASIPKSTAVHKYSKAPEFKLLPHSTHVVPQPKPESQNTQSAQSVLFQKALQSSTSHEQPTPAKPHKAKKAFKRHRSIFAVATSVTLLVAVGSLIAFANMSKIELKVANMRAGVDASLPGYEPEGYAKAGAISYQPGKVSITFKSSYNNQAYEVTQAESDLNSSTLQEEVLANSKPHQTIEQNGNTVYLYGDSDAAWVSGGILYTITGQANLSTNEILRIAASV